MLQWIGKNVKPIFENLRELKAENLPKPLNKPIDMLG